MKVLFNGASISIGGGIQAAATFLVRAVGDARCASWNYVVSEPLATQLTALGIDISAPQFEVVSGSPARSQETRARLLEAETRSAPDLVFTFFGPAYVRFKGRHLCGVADGWVTHSSSLAYSSLGPWRAQLFMFALCVYKGIWFRRADRWLVEAESAREGLCKRLRIDASQISIVQNTCGMHYLEAQKKRDGIPVTTDTNRTHRILVFAAYYAHKNLEIAAPVAKALATLAPELDFEIALTIRADSPEWEKIHESAVQLGVADRVLTLGPVDVVDGPALYESSDVVLHPSLLETFSATYPEAMAMETPIVATDLAFARDVCGGAALYYSPVDADEAAEKIFTVLSDDSLRGTMIEAGKRALSALPNPGEKFEQLMTCILDGQEDRLHAGPNHGASASVG